jgi:hypothetical protein
VTNHRQRSNRNYRRNLRRRALLVSLGFTEDEAKRIVSRDGKQIDELWRERERAANEQTRELRAALKRDENARYPVQPRNPQSVHAIPVAFESSRRKH